MCACSVERCWDGQGATSPERRSCGIWTCGAWGRNSFRRYKTSSSYRGVLYWGAVWRKRDNGHKLKKTPQNPPGFRQSNFHDEKNEGTSYPESLEVFKTGQIREHSDVDSVWPCFGQETPESVPGWGVPVVLLSSESFPEPGRSQPLDVTLRSPSTAALTSRESLKSQRSRNAFLITSFLLQVMI